VLTLGLGLLAVLLKQIMDGDRRVTPGSTDDPRA